MDTPAALRADLSKHAATRSAATVIAGHTLITYKWLQEMFIKNGGKRSKACRSKLPLAINYGL